MAIKTLRIDRQKQAARAEVADLGMHRDTRRRLNLRFEINPIARMQTSLIAAVEGMCHKLRTKRIASSRL